MKKIILQTFLYIFISSLAYGQTTSGDVTYQVSLNFSRALETLEGTNANEVDKSDFKKSFTGSDDYFIELKFNNDTSLSKKQIAVRSDNKPNLSLTKLTSGGENIVFNNLKDEQVLLKRSNLGDTLIIQKPWVWELSDETKIIKGRVCYKATTIRQVENTLGIINDEIIAWYSKEIPLPFGPYIYCGLPGLILEVRSNKGLITYSATQISLNKTEEIVIDIPKLTIISQKEADRIMMSNYSKLIQH